MLLKLHYFDLYTSRTRPLVHTSVCEIHISLYHHRDFGKVTMAAPRQKKKGKRIFHINLLPFSISLFTIRIFSSLTRSLCLFSFILSVIVCMWMWMCVYVCVVSSLNGRREISDTFRNVEMKGMCRNAQSFLGDWFRFGSD